MTKRNTRFSTRTVIAPIFAGVALTLSAVQANAICLNPGIESLPTIPDGTSASMLEMQVAQYEVQQYVRNTEARLVKCIGESDMRHNATVARLERVAGNYNIELWLFLSNRDRPERDSRIDS